MSSTVPFRGTSALNQAAGAKYGNMVFFRAIMMLLTVNTVVLTIIYIPGYVAWPAAIVSAAAILFHLMLTVELDSPRVAIFQYCLHASTSGILAVRWLLAGWLSGLEHVFYLVCLYPAALQVFLRFRAVVREHGPVATADSVNRTFYAFWGGV